MPTCLGYLLQGEEYWWVVMSNQLELVKIGHNFTEKLTLMFLTASTASVAYILVQIRNTDWSYLIYLPMASLLLLGVSFFFGASVLKCSSLAAERNALALSIPHPESNKEMKIAANKYEKSISQANNYATNAVKHSSYQAYLFFAGAIVYAVYVFLEIYLKSNHIQ